MTIRDRGKIKWQMAYALPELLRAQRNMWRDSERINKPIIDIYELEEFDSRIAYAMEYNLVVKITVFDDGFTSDINGRIHYVDPITHQLRIEVKPGEMERIDFDSVIGVKVIDQ
jgi:hypothetical protein